MNSDTLRELLRHRPFQPFELRLSNGDKLQVRHPENAVLLKTRIIIGDPETDRSWIVSLVHINAIETLQAA